MAAAASARGLLAHVRSSWRLAFTRPRALTAAHSGWASGVAPVDAPPPTAERRSVDEAEVRKFGAQAAQWWRTDGGGSFAPLHALNALRVPLVRRSLLDDGGGDTSASPAAAAAAAFRAAGGLAPGASRALEGFTVLDVGCGGGILSEPLARLGATVTGLDASPDNVAAASAHASHDPGLAPRLTYVASTAEAMAASGATFDAVVASEVLEHVADFGGFIAACAAMVKPGGVFVVTTINRTPLALGAAILGAEYILRLVPAGTHEWAKFVPPEELEAAMRAHGLTVVASSGMLYNPVTGRWSWTRSTAVNYAMVGARPRLAATVTATSASAAAGGVGSE